MVRRSLVLLCAVMVWLAAAALPASAEWIEDAGKRGMRWLIVACIFLAGCAGVAVDIDSLRGQGYQKLPLSTVNMWGKRGESQNFEFWAKESRGTGRTAQLCLVPKTTGLGYHWWASVYVDGREAWGYESGPLLARLDGRLPVDCTTSPPLPEGRLSYRVRFTY